MSLVIRNAIAAAVEQVFAGKERAALLEAVLHRILTAEAEVGGPGRGEFTLDLDALREVDTSAEKVEVKVDPDGRVTFRPTTAAPAAAKRAA